MAGHLESWGSTAGAVFSVGLLMLAAWGAGVPLVRVALLQRLPPLDAALLRLAGGLTLVAWLAAALGPVGLLAGARSVVLLVGLALCSVPGWWRTRRVLPAPLAKTSGRWWNALPPGFLATAATGLVTLGPALAFPAGWDELVYHHTLPQRWLADGWPAWYADLPYSGFPSMGELLFWLMAPIDGAIAPRLMIWVCFLLALIILYRLLRPRLSKGAALTLVVAFAASETLLLIAANCYVEALLTMNVAAVLLAFRRIGGAALAESPRMAGLHGVLVGGAAAVKLTGLAVLVLPLLWLLIVGSASRTRRGEPARAWRSVAVCLIVAAVVCLPFYLRPCLATGNPWYPYFAAWFTHDPARMEMSQYHHALGGAAFGVQGVAAFVTGPLLLAFSSANYDGSFGWQSAILVVLAAVGVTIGIRRSNRRLVMWPAAAWLWLYAFWFFTAQQARFATHAMLLIVLLAGIGLAQTQGRRRWWLVAGLLAATAVSLPWRTAGYYAASWESVVGLISRSDYVADGTGQDYALLLQAIEQQTPPDARVMLLFEHRGFYVPRRHVIGTPFFQERGFTPPESFGQADKVMEVLASEHVTHVVMTKAPAGPDRAAQWYERLDPLFRGLEQCVQSGRLALLWESDRYFMLAVRQASAPAAESH